jgi:hypothetical protein
MKERDRTVLSLLLKIRRLKYKGKAVRPLLARNIGKCV